MANVFEIQLLCSWLLVEEQRLKIQAPERIGDTFIPAFLGSSAESINELALKWIAPIIDSVRKDIGRNIPNGDEMDNFNLRIKSLKDGLGNLYEAVQPSIKWSFDDPALS